MADFDKKIADALENDETFLGIIAQLKEAASATTTVIDRTPCTNEKCNCKHFRTVSVPDYKLKMQIIEFLANRGVGRPAQVEGESGESVQFESVFDWGCENCTCPDCLKDRGEDTSA